MSSHTNQSTVFMLRADCCRKHFNYESRGTGIISQVLKCFHVSKPHQTKPNTRNNSLQQYIHGTLFWYACIGLSRSVHLQRYIYIVSYRIISYQWLQ